MSALKAMAATGILATQIHLTSVQADTPIDVAAFKEPIRVACLGDSITAGAGLPASNAYPSQLGQMLGGRWQVHNFGVSGVTLLNQGDSPYRRSEVFTNALAFQPQVVIIQLGTNDSKPWNWKFKQQFTADYKNLIEQFAVLPAKPRIFLCRPAPVTGENPFGITELNVREATALIDKLAQEQKLTVIDIGAALKRHPDTLPDHVHPNATGAQIMAKTVYRVLTGKDYGGPSTIVEEKKITP